jgi:hypothetical protein
VSGNYFHGQKENAEFMQQLARIMSQVSCKTLKQVHMAIQRKSKECWHMILSSSIAMHACVCLHSSTAGIFQMEFLWWPCLQPSDYHLVTCLKNWLRSWHLNSDKSSLKVVKYDWAHGQQTSLTQAHKILIKIIPQYDKCFKFCGDYGEN